jgi:hypothetical protein
MIALLLWVAGLIIGVAIGLNYTWIWRWLLAIEMWVIGKFSKPEEL